MDSQDYEEARSMYFKYRAGLFSMKREGEYNKYQAFNVPGHLEKKWREEMRDEYIDKLELETSNSQIRTYFGRLCDLIPRFSHNTELHNYLLEFVEKRKSRLDSFTLLLMSEEILRGVEEHDWDAWPDIRKRAVEVGLGILRELLENPITISEEYKRSPHMANYDFSVRYQIMRIEADLRHFGKMLR